MELEKYFDRINCRSNMRRGTKREQLDEIDMFDRSQSEKEKIKQLAEDSLHNNPPNEKMTFWDSPEAYRLFNVKVDESVLDVISNRDIILNEFRCVTQTQSSSV